MFTSSAILHAVYVTGQLINNLGAIIPCTRSYICKIVINKVFITNAEILVKRPGLMASGLIAGYNCLLDLLSIYDKKEKLFSATNFSIFALISSASVYSPRRVNLLRLRDNCFINGVTKVGRRAVIAQW